MSLWWAEDTRRYTGRLYAAILRYKAETDKRDSRTLITGRRASYGQLLPIFKGNQD